MCGGGGGGGGSKIVENRRTSFMYVLLLKFTSKRVGELRRKGVSLNHGSCHDFQVCKHTILAAIVYTKRTFQLCKYVSRAISGKSLNPILWAF